MEAKDTVIKPDELGLAIIKHPELPMGQAIAEAQAEISFKAGIEEAQNRLHSPKVLAITKEALKEERLKGIRQVLYKMGTTFSRGNVIRYLPEKEWQELEQEVEGK